MEEEKNKIVQSLYLCTTNSREKMQQSIVENILYTLDAALSKSEIVDFIKSEFHLEIDEFELNELLEKLTSENLLKYKDEKFSLTEENKKIIYSNVLENQDAEKDRKKHISELIKSFNENILQNDVEKITNLFNEYIYEAFLEYGRNAISFFTPFKNDKISNGNLLKLKINKLDSENHKKIFNSLVSTYVENLTKKELDYLENLALKAEYFFSLGITNESFSKVQDFKINGLVVLVDTNFIYSVLKLHSHKQNDSCNQIIKLINEERIDCRLVYIRKTFEELQNTKKDFDRSITSEKLTYNQIKSLLDSDKLNVFSKEYFEKKLIDPDTPHPSDKILHSQKIMTSKKIQIFNYQFPHLEEEKALNAKFEDYYDYINIKNEVRANLNIPEINQKADKKLEHDIYLREAVITLRKEKNKINDLNYICLTLDKGLIDFDRFANSRNSKGKEDIAPNFILPSIFLRRIRPFIPIITDDYKKAFISSITSNTIDNSLPQYSDAVQRSMTYFKKLGIDDYDLIISIIKNELFFKDFIESESSDKQEEFIRSEIDKQYRNLKNEDISNREKLIKIENEKKVELEYEEEKRLNLENKIKKINTEKEELEKLRIDESFVSKKELLKEKEKNFNILLSIKQSIISKANKKYHYYLIAYFSCLIGYYIMFIIITYNIGWEKMEPITYFLGPLGIIVTYIYSSVTGKSLNPLEHFKKKKSDLETFTYRDFNFDIENYNKLKDQIKDLKDQINQY